MEVDPSFLAEPRDPEGGLGQHDRRRPQRHADHGRRPRLVFQRRREQRGGAAGSTLNCHRHGRRSAESGAQSVDQQRPRRCLDRRFSQHQRRNHGAAGGDLRVRARHHAARDQSPGTVRRHHLLIQSAGGRRRSARRSTAIGHTMQNLHVPISVHGSFAGTAQIFQQSLSSEPALIVAAIVAVYIVLGVLYESYVHPITILSTLPSAGRRRRAGAAAVRHRVQSDRADRRHPADRHRQEERDHDDRLSRSRPSAHGRWMRARRSTRPACCASVRS